MLITKSFCNKVLPSTVTEFHHGYDYFMVQETQFTHKDTCYIPPYTGENDRSDSSICLSMLVISGNLRVGSMSTSSCIFLEKHISQNGRFSLRKNPLEGENALSQLGAPPKPFLHPSVTIICSQQCLLQQIVQIT